jgi:hypothetical protein
MGKLLFPWDNFFPTYIGSKAKLREKNKEKKKKSVGTFFPLVTKLGSKTAGDAVSVVVRCFIFAAENNGSARER